MHTQSPAEKGRVERGPRAESDGFRSPDRLFGVGIRQDYPRAARDVQPGECWAFTDHRTMAEIIAEGLL